MLNYRHFPDVNELNTFPPIIKQSKLISYTINMRIYCEQFITILLSFVAIKSYYNYKRVRVKNWRKHFLCVTCKVYSSSFGFWLALRLLLPLSFPFHIFLPLIYIFTRKKNMLQKNWEYSAGLFKFCFPVESFCAQNGWQNYKRQNKLLLNFKKCDGIQKYFKKSTLIKIWIISREIRV